MDALALLRQLKALGPSSPRALCSQLGISQPTFSRTVSALGAQVMALGRGPATQYVATREVEGIGHRQPLFSIDDRGQCKALGDLVAYHPRGWLWVSTDGVLKGVYPTIPFYLWDVRPQGYLGRQFVASHGDLGLPRRVDSWSDDQVMLALCRRGEDLPGNLLAGEQSFDRYQRRTGAASQSMTHGERASLAISGNGGGSSAGGEQPKFTDSGRVIVKFSPPLSTEDGRRWADLLRAEAHAHAVLNEAGVAAAQSRVVDDGVRVYLEVIRFDRTEMGGRVGCISLGALDDEFIGQRKNWSSTAATLCEKKMLSRDDLRGVRLIEAFGLLTANTDMHFANLSFFWQPGEKSCRIAPVYDMLPMLFAPVSAGEVHTPTFTGAVPRSDLLEVWPQARAMAARFWQRVTDDTAVSASFRRVCADILSAHFRDLNGKT